MRKLNLAALGWFDVDAPQGNRLRWHIPADEIDSVTGEYMGLPHTIVVERSPVEWGGSGTPPAASGYTTVADELIPDIFLSGGIPVEWTPAAPLQRLRFTYRGPTAWTVITDSTNFCTVFSQVLNDGERIDISGNAIDMVKIYSWRAELRDVWVLDPTKPTRSWTPLARIGVRLSDTLSFADVKLRYPGSVTMDESMWNDLVRLSQEAAIAHPRDKVEPAHSDRDPNGEIHLPSAWVHLQLALATRWEHAVLFGHGFLDGPRGPASHIDAIDLPQLLRSPGSMTQGYVYRVSDLDMRFAPSDEVFCPSTPLGPLAPPLTLGYDRATVYLNDAKFETSVRLSWRQRDALAAGVEVAEEISDSKAIGSPASTETFRLQSRDAELKARDGAHERTFDVPFHDVTLRARAKAIDAWDRESSFTAWTAPVPLDLAHEAIPPLLAAACHSAGQTVIDVRQASADYAGWKPDIIVEKAAGRVEIWRQNLPAGGPRVVTCRALAPLLRPDGTCEVVIADAIANASDFVGGSLVASPFRATIVSVSGATFHLRVFNDPSQMTLFSAGAVTLYESPKREGLWIKVTDFDATALAATLTFSDTVPGPGEFGDTLTYAARVAWLGRRGPLGNSVQAIRLPSIPPQPPPFTVARLGVDFYGRTGLRLELTKPVAAGHFKTASASGAQDGVSFIRAAVPGEPEQQEAFGGNVLYSMATLAVPKNLAADMTMGVQQVTAGGSRSDFSLVRISIPPEL